MSGFSLGHLRGRARKWLQRRQAESECAALGRQLHLSTHATASVQREDLEILRACAVIRATVSRMPAVLIDVGANSGHFSRIFNYVFEPQRIVCFEPDQDLNDELKENVPLAKTAIHNLALSHTAGVMEFFVHPVKAMNSLLPSDPDIIRNQFQVYDPEGITSRSVDVATLDSVLNDDHATRSSSLFLKIDTQGNEMEVLQGAVETLKRTDACLIEFMFSTPYRRSGRFVDLINYLSQHGFECRGPLTVMQRSQQITGVDFLFVPHQVAIP